MFRNIKFDYLPLSLNLNSKLDEVTSLKQVFAEKLN